jgi:predicted PhzF superfamily epimerase YddE/YHI9
MSIPLHHVDAFAERAFQGNPAAVVLLPGPRSAEWMQNVAAEMNLSETAFLHREGDGWRLRWFTPAVEVALCGHATLASAHVLWESGLAAPDVCLKFETLSGPLMAQRRGDLIELDFPGTPTEPAAAPVGLLEALGAAAAGVHRSRFDYLVELTSPGIVRELHPDQRALRALPVRGVIVTSRSDQPQYDFISRFFAPGSGIDEDPVTGSAHCALGPFWETRLGKSEFTAYQASRRGGTVRVRVCGARVHLGGVARTISRGELLAE